MKIRYIKRLTTATAILLLANAQNSMGQEILENTSFENYSNSISPWIPHSSSGELEWQGKTGSRSVYIKNRASANHGVRQSIKGEINKGQILNVSAWVKLKNGSSSANSKILLRIKDANGWGWIPLTTTATNGWSWQQLQGTWTADWSGTLDHLSLCVAGPNKTIEMLIDDITATVDGGGSSNPPAGGGQILANTGMEDSTENLDPWVTDNATATIEWQGHSGSRSAYARAADSNFGYGFHQDIIGQISQGQTLEMSAWVKLKTGSSSSTSTMYVLLEDANGWEWNEVSTENTNGWSWKELAGSWTANWSGTLQHLSVYVSGPSNNGGMLVDDVTATVGGGGFTGEQNPVGNCGSNATYSYSSSGMFAYWVGGAQNFRNDNLGRNIDWRETELGYCFSVDKWLTNGVWHGDVSMDFTPTNNSHLINTPKPSNFNDSLLPFSVAWVNTQAANDYGSHQEFNIRLTRRNGARSNRSDPNEDWGYGTKTINSIPAATLDLDFEGYFSCGSEGPIKINNTMWIQNQSGPRQNNSGSADRIDIIVHEYDSGLIDWRRMVDPTNQDYINGGSNKRWAVVSPEPARDGMPAVNVGRPALNMDGSDYLIIRRSPGDEGEKCSYNIIRKNARGPNSSGQIGGTIEFKKLLNYLIAHDRLNGSQVFDGNWFIPNVDWTVTGQGRYNLKYNETRFGGDGQNVRTIPSKGKWTFTKAELPDFDTY